MSLLLGQDCARILLHQLGAPGNPIGVPDLLQLLFDHPPKLFRGFQNGGQLFDEGFDLLIFLFDGQQLQIGEPLQP